MADEPLIVLEEGGTAPVLRYDIPEPTSYEGKNFIELVFDDDIFVESANDMPSFTPQKQLRDRPKDEIKSKVDSYLKSGVSGSTELPTLPLRSIRTGFPTQPDPHLYLVESLRLTSYLGDYGAGRIVRTFTLLPGERTRISVKTFRQRESDQAAYREAARFGIDVTDAFELVAWR